MNRPLITLLGYHNRANTVGWVWNRFTHIFREMGYPVDWRDAHCLDTSISARRVYILWNQPDVMDLVESGVLRPDDIVLQKLTSLGKDDGEVNWGWDPLGFFSGWHWPLYQKLHDAINIHGVNAYGFGCATDGTPFHKKWELCKLIGDDRIFWIPWGSSVFNWYEIQRIKPIIREKWEYDLCYVGSLWGVPGRGNVVEFGQYVSPLVSQSKSYFLRGRGFDEGPIPDEEYKEALRVSNLCPIIHLPSWRVERGVQDRFWTVFTAGRFGVCDNEGVYRFFDKKDVVVATNPQEFVDKSLYYANNPHKQEKFIKKVQEGIRREYNYYKSWETILRGVGVWE